MADIPARSLICYGKFVVGTLIAAEECESITISTVKNVGDHTALRPLHERPMMLYSSDCMMKSVRRLGLVGMEVEDFQSYRFVLHILDMEHDQHGKPALRMYAVCTALSFGSPD